MGAASVSGGLLVRDMTTGDEDFVGSCTHIDETEDWTASSARRLPWLRARRKDGLRVKVALLDDERAGFLYLMPIEVCPWGPDGHDLTVIQCLVVSEWARSRGVGRALVDAAREEALEQGSKGLVVTAWYCDFWFMPAAFFECCGFEAVRRAGERAILWKVLETPAEAPRFLESAYRFVPEQGRVTIDLFWTRSCLTTDTEAQRVREVAGEYGEAVLLREHCTDDPAVRDRWGLTRGIYIDGVEAFWGYEAPREGLRKMIDAALRGRNGNGEQS